MEFFFEFLIIFCHVLLFDTLLMLIWHSFTVLSQLFKEDLNLIFSFVYACASVFQFVHVSAVPVGASRGCWIPWHLSYYYYPV